VVDTGGIVPDDKAAIPREILRQAQVAIEGASQLLLIVDGARDSRRSIPNSRTCAPYGQGVADPGEQIDTQMQESLARRLRTLE